MTRQRRIILDVVRESETHPSADEVYVRVRRRLPKISLGTVYRNLEILAERGDIRKLEVGGTQKRFDGNASAHGHVRCLNCGRVVDAPSDQDLGPGAAVLELAGFEITGCSVEFLGYCPKCRRRRPKANQSGRNRRRNQS